MTDAITFAAVLLIVGPLAGAVPVANPRLVPIWSMSREDHLATVGAHRRGWALLNAGFAFATILTTGGLLLMAGAIGGDGVRTAALTLAAVAYGVGGSLWCAFLGIRTRVTPTLADLVASGASTEPAEALVGAATGGLFAAFVVITGAALAGLGGTLLLAGGLAVPVAGLVALAGVLSVAWLATSGDIIPAVLYPPTMLIGVALLAGWR